MKQGFTLIEISIALVIIGLIVGGILTGGDLIDAATQRAQIAQIEKYHTAVRTFQGKYGHLPGDIIDPLATRFGFQTRGTKPGEGDGNDDATTATLAAGLEAVHALTRSLRAAGVLAERGVLEAARVPGIR